MTTMAANSDAILAGLANLLNVEKEARDAASLKELAFVIANRTHAVIPYDTAAVWAGDRFGGSPIAAISGVSLLDRDAPYVRWLAALFPYLARSASLVPRSLSPQGVPTALAQEWGKWAAPHALWCPFADQRAHPSGGMLLLRQTPFSENEIATAARLAGAYSHALVALRARVSPRWWHVIAPVAVGARRWLRWAGAALLVATLFFPVHQSVLAPVTVSPRTMVAVTAPMDGVVERIEVTANEPVAAGVPLFRLDPTAARNRYEVAVKALRVAEADLLKNAQMAFSDPDSKARVALSRAQIEQRRTEAEFAEHQLARLTVRAPVAGAAVFGDANDWLGRPVNVGERVMVLADPDQVELEMWLPVGDMIDLRKGTQVVAFLNAAPLSPLNATLTAIAYEAVPSPEGVLGYRLKAALSDASASPRLGLRGTAKVYGPRVPLVYYLFRRPLSAFRQAVGI